MIFSKANLLVSQVASTDPMERHLHGVWLEEDGGTVATNGRVMLAVGPANEEKVKFPRGAAEQTRVEGKGMLVPVEFVDRALKHLPKDRRAALQHVALCRVKDPARIGLTSVDAKGDPTTDACLPKGTDYPDWKRTLRRLRGDPEHSARVCVSRKDLGLLLKALEAACPDRGGGGWGPVFIEIGAGGAGLVVRCVSDDTGQHVVGAVSAMSRKTETGESVSPELPKDAWERRVMQTPAKRLKEVQEDEQA